MTRREEIEKVANEFYKGDEVSTFVVAAQWADKTMIEKTISWFYKNAHKPKYWDKDGCLLITIIIDDYRSAMEE